MEFLPDGRVAMPWEMTGDPALLFALGLAPLHAPVEVPLMDSPGHVPLPPLPEEESMPQTASGGREKRCRLGATLAESKIRARVLEVLLGIAQRNPQATRSFANCVMYKTNIVNQRFSRKSECAHFLHATIARWYVMLHPSGMWHR